MFASSRLRGRGVCKIRRGKSGHRRAGRLITSGEGDFKESATEIDRRFERQGWKGEVRAHRRDGNAPCHVNPVRCKVGLRSYGLPARMQPRILLERIGDDTPR